MKRSLFSMVLLCCCAFVGCGEDSDCKPTDDPCKELKCDQEVGGYSKFCAIIDGHASCQIECNGDKEGQNAAVCWTNPSIDETVVIPQSIADICSKDDNGKLYVSIRSIKDCDAGCNEATGLCKAQEVDPCEKLQCEHEVGGYSKICAIIDGKASCEYACAGDKEGQNAAVCWTNPSIDETVVIPQSIVDTCSKDDKGKLYASDRISSDCSYGCDESVGICKTQEIDPCEDLHCDEYAGGIEHICAIVNGEASCKPKCFGTQEGQNAPVCFENNSLPPDADRTSSITAVCNKDDNGSLYTVDYTSKTCENGCDASEGICAD